MPPLCAQLISFEANTGRTTHFLRPPAKDTRQSAQALTLWDGGPCTQPQSGCRRSLGRVCSLVSPSQPRAEPGGTDVAPNGAEGLLRSPFWGPWAQHGAQRAGAVLPEPSLSSGQEALVGVPGALQLLGTVCPGWLFLRRCGLGSSSVDALQGEEGCSAFSRCSWQERL